MAEVGKRDKGLGVKQGERIRRLATFTIRTCYRSVCNHPFAVVMLLILFLLYRSFPFLFSLLVSASPVLVCTAILLGVLLSFGQPNIPEIEREEITTTTTNLETASLRTALHNDATFVERDESFVAERFSVRRNDVVEKLIAEEIYATGMVSGVGRSLPSNATPVVETSREIPFEKKLVEDIEEEKEEERGLDDSELEMNSGLNKEKHEDEDGEDDENRYSQIENVEEENVELLHDQSSPVGSFDSCMADRADSSPCSPWKRVGEEDDVDDEASDTGSDGAESSSPDASMADIIPMLDELHPLLDEDAPQPAQISHDGSDAGSERSQRSSENTNESDEDSENPEEEAGEEDEDEDDHDDEEDDEEGEETQDEQNDAIKSAITWTETDQKNLMDLGTSELERNQRLESLIARRRARRMMTEKNLIDLDNFDLPFSVAPISTARRSNPFDSSYDSHIPGLPPIPGSAPSIMLARSNPFDLPYDSSEEKPDLTGDNFQQEFVSLPPKEPFFRRHESFSVGPSFFGPPKQEKHETRFRPYFVPEHMASEGTSYSSFERQLSELSDSKVSSLPETESVCSVGDQDDKKLVEEDLSQEAELISHVEHPAELVGHGSESSEDDEHVVELGQAEKRDIQQDEVELVLGDGGSHSEPRDLSTYADNENDGVPPDTRPDEVNCSSRSSSSSSSEIHERIFVDKDDEVSNFEPATEDFIEDSSLPRQTSLEGSGLVDQGQHIEPVYDTSPTSIRKNRSSSSVSSDLLVDASRMDFTSGVVEREARESELSNPGDEQIFLDSLEAEPVEAEETRTSVATEIAENLTEYASVNSSPSPDEEELEDHVTKQDRSVRQEQIQDDLATNAHVSSDAVANETLLANLSVNDFSEKPMLESEGIPPSLEKATNESHAETHEILEPSIHQVDALKSLKESEAQPLSFSSEATDAEVHEKDIYEMSNEIKEEIDERILMELDVVGDFSVGELGSNSSKIEDKEADTKMPLVKARTIEDIDSVLNRTEALPAKTEAQTGDSGTSNLGEIAEDVRIGTSDLRDSSLTETKIELPIHGQRSMDDSEFKDALGLHIHGARSMDEADFKDALGSYADLQVERQSGSDSHDLRDSSLTERKIVIDRTMSISDYKDAIGSTDLHVEKQSIAESHGEGPVVAQVSETRPLEGTSLNLKLADEAGSSQEKKPVTEESDTETNHEKAESHESSSDSSSTSSSSSSDSD